MSSAVFFSVLIVVISLLLRFALKAFIGSLVHQGRLVPGWLYSIDFVLRQVPYAIFAIAMIIAMLAIRAACLRTDPSRGVEVGWLAGAQAVDRLLILFVFVVFARLRLFQTIWEVGRSYVVSTPASVIIMPKALKFLFRLLYFIIFVIFCYSYFILMNTTINSSYGPDGSLNIYSAGIINLLLYLVVLIWTFIMGQLHHQDLHDWAVASFSSRASRP